MVTETAGRNATATVEAAGFQAAAGIGGLGYPQKSTCPPQALRVTIVQHFPAPAQAGTGSSFAKKHEFGIVPARFAPRRTPSGRDVISSAAGSDFYRKSLHEGSGMAVPGAAPAHAARNARPDVEILP